LEEIMAKLMERCPEIDKSEAAMRALFLRDLKFDKQEPESLTIASETRAELVKEDRGSDITTDDDWEEDTEMDSEDDEDEHGDILPRAAAM
jgi:hypothetical protein